MGRLPAKGDGAGTANGASPGARHLSIRAVASIVAYVGYVRWCFISR